VKRWLPAPLLSATLFAVWLLLNNTVDAAHLVLGALVAIVVPWFTRGCGPTGRASAGHCDPAARLVVLWTS